MNRIFGDTITNLFQNKFATLADRAVFVCPILSQKPLILYKKPAFFDQIKKNLPAKEEN